MIRCRLFQVGVVPTAAPISATSVHIPQHQLELALGSGPMDQHHVALLGPDELHVRFQDLIGQLLVRQGHK